MADGTISAPVSNRYDRMEVAGAFGDLGTLVPFVVAYISILKMDPFGVLLAFGLAMVLCGFVYRTPMPVQPMKAAGAIATTQAAQTIVITPSVVWGASLATGIVPTTSAPCSRSRSRTSGNDWLGRRTGYWWISLGSASFHKARQLVRSRIPSVVATMSRVAGPPI